MNNSLKGVGQAAAPVLGTRPHPCPRLPTEGLNADSNAIPCYAQNHKKKKSTSLASGIISQTKDQTQEVEKKSHGSSPRTSKDKEEKKITKRL